MLPTLILVASVSAPSGPSARQIQKTLSRIEDKIDTIVSDGSTRDARLTAIEKENELRAPFVDRSIVQLSGRIEEVKTNQTKLVDRLRDIETDVIETMALRQWVGMGGAAVLGLLMSVLTTIVTGFIRQKKQNSTKE